MTDPFVIALTPAGHVLLRPAEPHEPGPELAAARRIRAAFERGHAAGLLHLGAADARPALPPAFAFWRDFGRAFVAALCALPDLEERRERGDPAPRADDFARLAAGAPPMPGGEYLTAEVLRCLWGSVREAWRAEMPAAKGTVQKWLPSQDRQPGPVFPSP